MTRDLPRFGALIVGVVCLASGCTTPSDPDPIGSTTPQVSVVVGDGELPPPTTSMPASTDNPVRGSWLTQMDPVPPLARYGVFLDGPGVEESLTRARIERHDKIQNAVASCMAEQGFRYTPVPFSADVAVERSRPSKALLYLPVPYLPTDRESALRWGYGVMPTIEEQMAAEGNVEDPNVAYTATLNPTEYEAFYHALLGDYRNPAATSGSSCSGKVLAQFPELTLPDRQQRFEVEYGDLLRALDVDLVGAPRTITLDAEWDACMIRKGYDLERMEGEHGPKLAMYLAVRTAPNGSVRAFAYEPVPVANILVEQKSLLGTEAERGVAVADYDCRVETNYMERITQIRIDLDNQFIAAHQAELDRLVATAQTW